MGRLSIETLLKIVGNENLQLEDEDQLLKMINRFYQTDSKYSILYEKVHFVNLSKNAMREFVEVFDFSDITCETWRNLSERLTEDCDSKSGQHEKNLNEKGMTFSIEQTKLMSGIINYLVKKETSSKEEISITSSSHFLNDHRYHPRNVSLYENSNVCFLSENVPDSWIRFEIYGKLSDIN